MPTNAAADTTDTPAGGPATVLDVINAHSEGCYVDANGVHCGDGACDWVAPCELIETALDQHHAHIADEVLTHLTQRGRDLITNATPTWHRGMYGCPQDMFTRADLTKLLTTLLAPAP